MKSKNVTMRKTNFVNGAIIATIGIVLTKILGIIYVIPFHSLIGEKGGALYGYAYTIYTFFLSISTAGIPLAISRLVSEYQTLGYYNVKKRVFILGKKIAFILGLISFILIILFAPFLAKYILGGVTGGNSVEDVTYVIRILGLAILIVPVLSIYRGYFEGHRFLSPPSISQVIEQFVRVVIIIIGSLFAIKVFKLNLTNTVGIALLGATVGAFFSYFYLLDKYKKNRNRFNERVRNVNEPLITNKMIIKKIFIYSIPFIMIDVFKSMYNYIDLVSVVKNLVKYTEYTVTDAETIYSMLSTWSNKFNMIILSISSGIVVSLIPSLTESVVKKNENDINKKINQALNMLLFFAIPMTFGISFLSKSIWTLFYGNSIYGPSVLSYYIFVGIFIALFTCMLSILQIFKDYKMVFISLISGVIAKFILNKTLLLGFYQVGLPPYYGFISASIIGYLLSFIVCIFVLIYKYNISFKNIISNLFEMLIGSILMILILFGFSFIVPIYSDVRIVNLFLIVLYGLIGCIIYFIYCYKSKIIKDIFGDKFFKSIGKIVLKR